MSSNTLWKHINYRSPLNFIIDKQIREYDITKANISILRDSNCINEEEYIYYFNLPKMEREIAIGNLEGKNPDISKVKKLGIENARRIFIESNQIPPEEILFIRNDAIAILGNRPIKNIQISEKTAFRLDKVFTSFYYVNHIDYLYYYNSVSAKEDFDIKGLGDQAIDLHRNFMIDFLLELFFQAQMLGVNHAINLLQGFYNKYINFDLDIGYYREMNAISRYRLNSSFSINSTLYLDYASKYDLKFIDTSFNNNLLMNFNKLFASVYFVK